jgi:hypothetical protein
MWILHRNVVSDEQQESIQRIQNRFRSGEIGDSEIVYVHLYTNRWGLVNQIDDSGNW